MREEMIIMTGGEPSTQVKRQYTSQTYWYNDAYDTLVSGLGRMQSYFAVLFLAPLMLPHSKRRDEARQPGVQEVAARQNAFLARQLAFIRGYQSGEESAWAQFTRMHDDCTDRHCIEDYGWYSDGQINKTETYKNAARFLSFFKDAAAEQIDSVAELYQRELELVFYRPEDAELLRAKVEAWSGWLTKRDVHVPALTPAVRQAGRVLLCTLLVQALDYPRMREGYLAPVERVLGAQVPPADRTEEVTLPAELFSELFTALCQPESFTLSGGRTLLNVLSALPEYGGQSERALLREAAKAARMRELQAVQTFLNAGDTAGIAAASQQANELTKLLAEIGED